LIDSYDRYTCENNELCRLVQVDFLNSVIVDLQRKNEALQLQLEAAVSLQNKLDDDVIDDVTVKYVTTDACRLYLPESSCRLLLVTECSATKC